MQQGPNDAIYHEFTIIFLLSTSQCSIFARFPTKTMYSPSYKNEVKTPLTLLVEDNFGAKAGS
jgi:hypothetical protein